MKETQAGPSKPEDKAAQYARLMMATSRTKRVKTSKSLEGGNRDSMCCSRELGFRSGKNERHSHRFSMHRALHSILTNRGRLGAPVSLGN
jgi:hypothetical protein